MSCAMRRNNYCAGCNSVVPLVLPLHQPNPACCSGYQYFHERCRKSINIYNTYPPSSFLSFLILGTRAHDYYIQSFSLRAVLFTRAGLSLHEADTIENVHHALS